FLTNNFALPAFTITELYRCRWQVELFFKWIKQHLRIKAFFGTLENAVKSQIWIAVSVYVLVAIVKKRLKLSATLYEILQICFQLRAHRKRAIDGSHRFAQLVALQRQSRRPYAIASHADPMLRELDQLHELHHRVHAQQRQKPLVERECLRLSSFDRIAIKRHRFRGERVDEPRDPPDCACVDGFDDGV